MDCDDFHDRRIFDLWIMVQASETKKYRLNNFGNGQPNNSFNASGNSIAFMRETRLLWRCVPPR
jgi:hypothetical protein